VTVTTPTDARPDAGGPAPDPAPPAPGAGRVAGILGGHLLFYGLVWTGIGALLLTANLVANGVWGDVDASVWNGQHSVFQYAMLAGGVMVVTGYLPAMIANGVTRRAAVDGGLVALAALAVGGAVLTTLAFAVEHLVFSINDWPHVLDDAMDLHIYERPDQYGLILVEVLGLYLTHALAGTVIGAGLFRYGAARGGGWLVIGVLIAVVSEYLLASGFVGVRLGDALGLDHPPVGAGIAGAVAIGVAGVVATRWLARGMPITIRHAAWWR
jgi:hypothetical protein